MCKVWAGGAQTALRPNYAGTCQTFGFTWQYHCHLFSSPLQNIYPAFQKLFRINRRSKFKSHSKRCPIDFVTSALTFRDSGGGVYLRKREREMAILKNAVDE